MMMMMMQRWYAKLLAVKLKPEPLAREHRILGRLGENMQSFEFRHP
jgi:hypothetical protein